MHNLPQKLIFTQAWQITRAHSRLWAFGLLLSGPYLVFSTISLAAFVFQKGGAEAELQVSQASLYTGWALAAVLAVGLLALSAFAKGKLVRAIYIISEKQPVQAELKSKINLVKVQTLLAQKVIAYGVLWLLLAWAATMPVTSGQGAYGQNLFLCLFILGVTAFLLPIYYLATNFHAVTGLTLVRSLDMAALLYRKHWRTLISYLFSSLLIIFVTFLFAAAASYSPGLAAASLFPAGVLQKVIFLVVQGFIMFAYVALAGVWFTACWTLLWKELVNLLKPAEQAAETVKEAEPSQA